MHTKIKIQIIEQISFAHGKERALKGFPAEAEVFAVYDIDDYAYQHYLKGYEEGKKERLKNLLLK